MSDKLRVFFLGSGDIAVPVLEGLSCAPGVELLGVVSQIDRPAGRKKLLTPTPVSQAADRMGLVLRKVPKVNDPEFVAWLKGMELDFIVVVSFGQLLKSELLHLPRYGCVNVHASLLPRYRGASPVRSAILNCESATGVSFMAMDEGMDTGAVYRMIERTLDGSERSDTLEIELGRMAAAEIGEVLNRIAAGELTPEKQDIRMVSYCSKLKKSDGLLDFTGSAAELDAKIRAYQPWPGGYFMVSIDGGKPQQLKIEEAVVSDVFVGGMMGRIVVVDRQRMFIKCGKGALEILSLTPAGKKTMRTRDYLNGVRDASLEIVRG